MPLDIFDEIELSVEDKMIMSDNFKNTLKTRSLRPKASRNTLLIK